MSENILSVFSETSYQVAGYSAMFNSVSDDKEDIYMIYL